MRISTSAAFAVSLMLTAGCSKEAAAPASAPAAPAEIPVSALPKVDAAKILDHIKVLSADDMEGRAPGTAGEEKAVAYIEGQFKQLGLQPGLLLRAQPLPRHRPFGAQGFRPAVPPGPPPPPHRPFRDPQVMRDLTDRVTAGEPPGGLQPQPLAPLLLSGRVPASLRIPHASVIRPRSPRVTTRALRVQSG